MLDMFVIQNKIMMQFAFYFLVAINILIISFYFVGKRSYHIEFLIFGNVSFLLMHALILLAINTRYSFAYIVNMLEVGTIIFYVFTILSLYDKQLRVTKYIGFTVVALVALFIAFVLETPLSIYRAITAILIVIILIDTILVTANNNGKQTLRFHIYINLNLLLYIVHKVILAISRIYSASYEVSIQSINNSVVMFTFVTIIFVLWFNLSILFLHYEKLYTQYKDMSMTDVLTNLPNRRYTIQKLEEYIELSLRDKMVFGVTMLDIDGFKQINDTYGHQVGDEVLKEFAYFMKHEIRHIDLVSRIGGDEFMLLIHAENTHELNDVLQRIILDLEQQRFSSKELQVSLSMGAVMVMQHKAKTGIDHILDQTDQLLYKAKEQTGTSIVFE